MRRDVVCPHGSSCAPTRISWPLARSSSTASATAAGVSTSNSIHACGTGRSTGHSVVPKVAWAAWLSGQIANALTPGRSSVWKYPRPR